MKAENRQFDKQNGSALILVVVVTVLLSVIGVMFMMVSRSSEMESAAAVQSKDLNNAVDTVVARVNEVLVEDLFGTNPARPGIVDANTIYADADEPWDYTTHQISPGTDGIVGTSDDVFYDDKSTPTMADDTWWPGTQDDYWLASLEPTFDGIGPDKTAGTGDDNDYWWPHITDLWGTLNVTSDSLWFQRFTQTNHSKFFAGKATSYVWGDPIDPLDEASAYNVRVNVIAPNDAMGVIDFNGSGLTMTYGARADADGDGVADSRWVQVPGLTSSRGEPVFAAVRIIDNCGMLNLNGAHCFYQEPYNTPSGSLLFKDATNKPVSPFDKPWFMDITEYNNFSTNLAGSGFNIAKGNLYHNNYDTGSGRYLTEINYLPFLRGDDLTIVANWYRIQNAKGFGDIVSPLTPDVTHQAMMNIESLVSGYSFFDISDEIELRNRFVIPSMAQVRYKRADIANFSLDSGGGLYSNLRTPVADMPAFTSWKIEVESTNFNDWDYSGSLTTNPSAYYYDRRHVCTTYSFDRNFRKGEYPLLDEEISNYIVRNGVPAAFANPAEYKDYLWEQWGAVFTAKGAVTTDIENFYDAQPYNNLETRKRILHLLYALREHHLDDSYFNSGTTQAQKEDFKNKAAIKAAQVVANLIDYSDDGSANTNTFGDTQGPFYSQPFTSGTYTINYEQQANKDATFITRDIVKLLLIEVSQAILGAGYEINLNLPQYRDFEFGLEPNPSTASTANDIVFGYERQPFISEIYTNWNDAPSIPGANLDVFAIELVNPYSDEIDIEDWTLNIGIFTHTFVASGTNVPSIPPCSPTGDLGRLVINFNNSVPPADITGFSYNILGVDLPQLQFMIAVDADINLLRPAPAVPVTWTTTDLLADQVSNVDLKRIIGAAFPGQNSLRRNDVDWGFIYDRYKDITGIPPTTASTLGTDNGGAPGAIVFTTPLSPTLNKFQLGVADDQNPVCRWHEIESLSLFGYDDAAATTPESITAKTVTEAGNTPPILHYDLEPPGPMRVSTSDLLDYITTINRPGDIANIYYPDLSSLPGRININTAPVPVIAAAIPPSLADPDVADPATPAASSALQLAQQIVDGRPYETLSDLLTKVPAFKQYKNGAFSTENVGMQSIDNDIEEEHWVLSNLANKFTVRSDVFTAYILVRIGEDGPQRRMIGIFDRSQVWDKTDRPKLVALHPVPDPR